MSNQQAVDKFRSIGNALRPGLVLSVCAIGGVLIGREYDRPVEGLAGGIASAAIVNGLLNWNTARQTT